MKRDVTKIIEQFGFDPTTVGLRYRGWWIVTETEEEEEQAEALVGDLCVRARDGGANIPDMSVGRYPNYRGTACDGFDQMYRYYYFSPLLLEGNTGEEKEDE